jgi:large subunit ribosomal protein L16
MMHPKRTKYRQFQKRVTRGHGVVGNGLQLHRGQYALQACEAGQLSARTLEAVRRVLTRRCKRVGRIWPCVFPDRAVSRKPAEVRMGKGKGAPSFWVAGVRGGQVLFTMEGMPQHLAWAACRVAASKLPLRVRWVVRPTPPTLPATALPSGRGTSRARP